MSEEPISVACEHCGVKLKLKDASAVGKKIKCPKCGQSFTAALVGSAAAPAAPSKKKRPPSAEAPPDDDDSPPDDEDADAEGEPRPKKKKMKGKKKKKQKESSALPFLIAGVALTLLLVVGGVVAAVMMGGGKRSAAVVAPELEIYKCGGFTIEVPKGWKMEKGGSENKEWVELVDGDMRVIVRDDSSGVGDIISGANRGVKMEDHTEETIHGVHLGKKDTIADDYGDYSEEEPIPYDCKLGMARMSLYKGKLGMFGGKYRGIRATAQSGTKTITVRTHCPEKAWETMKPVFDRICRSIAHGVRQ
jgi:hypothetical protein